MNLITGDIHGNIDIKKLSSENFKLGNKLTRKDNLFIAGDCGLWFDYSKELKYWRDWLNEKSWTTLVIDGNHENFDFMKTFPIETWNGGKIRRMEDNILWLQRGEIFNIDGFKYFIMGGATSIDKEQRIIGQSWWAEEIPNYLEIENAFNNLEKNNWCVDYVITHTCPQKEIESFIKGGDWNRIHDPVSYMLQEIKDKIEFKCWFFGHLHKNKKIGRFHAVYDDIIQIF